MTTAAESMPERDAIEKAARLILATGCGPFHSETVEWSLRRVGITAPADVLAVAPELIDTTLAIFDHEIRPFIECEFPATICYSSHCNPKARCVRADFGYGVEVEHSCDGSRWICEGKEYLTQSLAERAARREVFLMTLKSAIQQRQNGGRSAPRFGARGRRTPA